MPPADRHAILADPTRRAILDILRTADAPLGVRTVARLVGLHPNSTREQLRRLQEAGMVRRRAASPAGRGRPGHRYELDPDLGQDPYRVLADVLVDEVASLPAVEAMTSAAGERWGRSAAATLVGRDRRPVTEADGRPADTIGTDGDRSAGDASLGLLVDLLEDAGFAPEPPVAGDPELRLRACPFLPLETHRLPVVCGVHLGFIRGALRELGSSLDAVAIRPFAGPDLCVATLGQRVP